MKGRGRISAPGAFPAWIGLGLALGIASACTCRSPGSDPAPAPRELVIFAAASLRDAFRALGEEFEHAHPGVALVFNFAGTQELRTQIEHGARVDVFASADREHMSALRQKGRVGPARIFAHNEPIIVVSRASTAPIGKFRDLPRAGRLVIGSAAVPIGRYTNQILSRAGAALGPEFRQQVEDRVVSRELNVRQVLAKVRLGEADAGIVYRTDAAALGENVTVVPIPGELNVVAEYPIAVASDPTRPALADAFVDWVLSEAGQKRLAEAGFTPVQGEQ